MDFNMQGLGFQPGDVVVITGAASGIGRATANLAARSGLKVWAWDMMPEPLDQVVKEITEAGGQATGTVCDVTDTAAIARAWDEAPLVGPPRYLVNNAGPASNTPLTYQQGLTLATGSMINVTEEWLTRFADIAEATTFTSSIAAATGGPNWYNVAKTAIMAYSRNIAKQKGGKPRGQRRRPGRDHHSPSPVVRTGDDRLGGSSQPHAPQRPTRRTGHGDLLLALTRRVLHQRRVPPRRRRSPHLKEIALIRRRPSTPKLPGRRRDRLSTREGTPRIGTAAASGPHNSGRPSCRPSRLVPRAIIGVDDASNERRRGRAAGPRKSKGQETHSGAGRLLASHPNGCAQVVAVARRWDWVRLG